RENPEDILFIDASAGFEKVKNQNILRPEDIRKIVDTYRKRSEEAKFSHRASMTEIAENDYNLNIPRYVDTFEAEEEINLAAVTSAIRAIDKDMAVIDDKIKAFCAELGIEAPL